MGEEPEIRGPPPAGRALAVALRTAPDQNENLSPRRAAQVLYRVLHSP